MVGRSKSNYFFNSMETTTDTEFPIIPSGRVTFQKKTLFIHKSTLDEYEHETSFCLSKNLHQRI